MRNLRVSIAGLMGVVLAAAMGLAALRGATLNWLGASYLLTRGVLGLAILCALYSRGAARAWWVGFCLFGWGYLYLVDEGAAVRPSSRLPTSRLLMAVKPLFGHPATPYQMGEPVPAHDYFYMMIGHHVWSIAAAMLGGLLARILFALSADRSGPAPTPTPEAEGPTRGRRWVRPTVLGWSGLVLATSAAAIRSGWDAGFWAGATFLLTLGLLGLAGLGAIGVRGPTRHAWRGAALLGVGYLLLLFSRSSPLPLPTGQFLNALREGIPALAGRTAMANAHILDVLERPIPMRFPEPTPLAEVLGYIKRATATPTGPGLPLYLDPMGLREVEQRADSTVTIDLQGVPLRTTFRLLLSQLDMDYAVRDGYLWVTSVERAPSRLENPFHLAAGQPWELPPRVELSSNLEDPYLIVGHCLLALAAAGFGAVAAPIVAGAGRRSDAPAGKP